MRSCLDLYNTKLSLPIVKAWEGILEFLATGTLGHSSEARAVPVDLPTGQDNSIPFFLCKSWDYLWFPCILLGYKNWRVFACHGGGGEEGGVKYCKDFIILIILSLIPRPLPDFIHSCEIKSGRGLGMRYVILSTSSLSEHSAKHRGACGYMM